MKCCDGKELSCRTMVNCSQRAFIKIVKPLLFLFFCLVEKGQGRSMEVGIEKRSLYVTLPWWQNFWISTNYIPAKVEGKTKKSTCMTFLYMITLTERNGSPCFSSTVRQSANGCLCQERLLRYTNFATMVT